MNWHIGCSGFHYKHWKGTFYPQKLAQSKWFEYYCQFFKTLELNVTFYHFPQLPFLQSWHRRSPEDFRFAVKAPRAITHYKQFIGTTDLMTDFYRTVRDGLQEKLGCVLFQMPPRFTYSEERLERLLTGVDNSFLNVLEFRNETWWKDEIYHRLGQHNITFCGMSHPNLPDKVVENTQLLYYRLHGKEQLYSSNYTNDELTDILNKIRMGDKAKDCYIFFNNDINTSAVYNSITMMKLAGLRTFKPSLFGG